MTPRIYQQGLWWWIANGPAGAWHLYPFPSRSDAEEALQWLAS